ncbi:hypothetical protein AB4114_22225 [Paenibacillus sp. 2RAB27]|uniref:hypothetical protein n=1 Tax=Paenibacillus sp. 2RAB27 TaxID=3232991 RepID=UPI003F9BDC0F
MYDIEKELKIFPWLVPTEKMSVLQELLGKAITVDEWTKVTEVRGRRYIFLACNSTTIVSFPSDYPYEIGSGYVKVRKAQDDEWISVYEDQYFYLLTVPEGVDIRTEDRRYKSGYGYIRLKGDRLNDIKPIVLTHRLIMLCLFVEGANVLLTLGKGRKHFIRSLQGNKRCSSPNCLSIKAQRNFENWYIRRYCNNSRKNGQLDVFNVMLESNRLLNWEEALDFCMDCQ